MTNNSYYLDKTKSKDSFPEIETVNGKFCKYCGSHIDLDSIFCPECGRRVENISADQAGSERIFVNNTTVNNTTNNINYTTVNMGESSRQDPQRDSRQDSQQRYQSPPQTSAVPVGYGRRIDKWTAFLLCLFLGVIGAHKFYEGRTATGILYILTGGLFGLGWLADIFIILGKSDPYWV